MKGKLLLGKGPKKEDVRTFKLGALLDPALPDPPPSLDLTEGIASWPMYQNDVHADCTCAAAAHMREVWSLQVGAEVMPTDADVLALYAKVNGGVDEGAVCLDVLNSWRNFGFGGEKISAFAEVNVGVHLKLAMWLFSGLYVGFNLPLSAKGQAVWDVPDPVTGQDGRPGSWGGHCVSLVGYTDKSVTVVTWGRIMQATWAFVAAYMDEAWAILPDDYLALPQGKTLANGLDYDKLQADLRAVGMEK